MVVCIKKRYYFFIILNFKLKLFIFSNYLVNTHIVFIWLNMLLNFLNVLGNGVSSTSEYIIMYTVL